MILSLSNMFLATGIIGLLIVLIQLMWHRFSVDALKFMNFNLMIIIFILLSIATKGM